MKSATLALFSLPLMTSACGPHEILAPEKADNIAPTILEGFASCSGEGAEAQWTFYAKVDDVDGLEDIQEVHAYVYDESTNLQEDNFALVATQDLALWQTHEAALNTSLDCAFANYSVDFLATDTAGDSGEITSWAGANLGG